MYKLDKSKWNNYIKIYEEFVKGIPDDLKEIFLKIRKDIGNRESSFEEIIDLESYGMIKGVKIRFVVEFEKSDQTDYYSNINIFELLDPKENKIIDVPIHIRDKSMDVDKLISVISHEIRHVYDAYIVNNESDIESFVKSLYLYKIRKNTAADKEFDYFLNLVYLSLEHELIARNTMIYENFINCRCDKEELFTLFEKTFIYESLVMLRNFDHKTILKGDRNELIKNTKKFVEFFKEYTDIENIEEFYKNWEIYFKNKSDEYLKEAYDVLDTICSEEIKEKFHPLKYPSYKEYRNAKNVLLDIVTSFSL